MVAVYDADPFPSKVFQIISDRIRSSKTISLRNTNNEKINFTIMKGYISLIISDFTFMLYNNTVILLCLAIVIKLKHSESSLKTLFAMECARI
jgi:hypothetical protein